MINDSLNTIEFKLGLFLTVSIILYVFLRYRKRSKVVTAAEVFKEKVLAELEGLYPVPRYLDKDMYDRFKTSIPAIKLAAAEFRKYVPGSSKKSFDAALDSYISYCHQTTWQDCVAFKILPGERKPEDEGPREIFRQKVNALLSFAKP